MHWIAKMRKPLNWALATRICVTRVVSQVQYLENKLSGALRHNLIRFFYRFFYGRHTPGAESLGRIISRWEQDQRQGDVPLGRDTWESLYRQGAWEFLSQLDEISRYSVLVGYLHYLKPRGATLDVGCGEGLLFDRLRSSGYSRYVGLDLSEVAIAALRSRQDETTRFLQADAETYVPDEVFDVIVFNESLYYFHDPLGVAQRYAQSLKPGGLLVVSLYQGSPRARAIRALLHRRLQLLDETRIEQAEKAWSCGVFFCAAMSAGSDSPPTS